MRPMRCLYLLVAVALSSCGFGYGVVRSSDGTVFENVGANRYVYRSTRLANEAARGPAAPALAAAPAGAREIALIEVTVEYSGAGGGGLRSSEADFFPTLAQLAGELGGTHFLVLRTSRQAYAMGDWISAMSVDVLDAQ
jgi:hypothetical protein